jgi:hypothetical protein
VVAPNLRVLARGWVEIDGRRLELADEPAGQTHLWGRKHAHAWAWGHAVAFTDGADAALEILSVRLARHGLVTPPITLAALRLGDERLTFTGLRHAALARARFGGARFAFAAGDLLRRVEGTFTCRPEQMLLAEYRDPDGEPAYCANTEIGDLDLVVRRRGLSGWREQARLEARGTAHFEIAGRSPDPAVAARHVRV